MKLVERLGGVLRYLYAHDMSEMCGTVAAAIERIEAADAVDGEMPRDLRASLAPILYSDALHAIRDYRTLANRQDGDGKTSTDFRQEGEAK